MKKSKRWIGLIAAIAMVVAMVSVDTTVYADSLSSAETITFGDKVSGSVDTHNYPKWYKIKIPKDIEDQEFKITVEFKKSNDSRDELRICLCDDDGLSLYNQWSYIDSHNSTMLFRVKLGGEEKLIRHNFMGCYDDVQLKKGKTYYLKCYTTEFSSIYGGGKYVIKVGGHYKNDMSLKVTANEGEKTVTVSTVDGSKVTVTSNHKILKDGDEKVSKMSTTADGGKAKIKLSRKLKPGDVIKVKVSKDGYETKTKRIAL